MLWKKTSERDQRLGVVGRGICCGLPSVSQLLNLSEPQFPHLCSVGDTPCLPDCCNDLMKEDGVRSSSMKRSSCLGNAFIKDPQELSTSIPRIGHKRRGATCEWIWWCLWVPGIHVRRSRKCPFPFD